MNTAPAGAQEAAEARTLQTNRVVWHEGLFMRPQHLQQSERHLEWLIQSCVSLLSGFGFGFRTLKFDDALGARGKIGILAASGILRDGTPFDLPNGSTCSPLEVPPGTIDTFVHLCAVERLPDRQEFRLEGSGADERRTRYVCHDTEVVDSTNPGNRTVVRLGSLALTLALDGQVEGSLTSLPVARIRKRAATGVIELDNDFIPPALSVRAHPRLLAWIVDLCGLVKVRGDAQAERYARQGESPYDFLMLQLCNRFQPMLEQWEQGLPIHPAQMHAELLKFAGECRTLDAKQRRAIRFPVYSQDNIAASLEPVIEEIRRALVDVPGEDGIRIALQNVRGGYLGAELTDSRITDSGYYVLGATAQMSDDDLRNQLPDLVKVGAPQDVLARVDSHEHLIRLRYLPSLPRGIRLENGYQYFRLLELATEEPFWSNIRATRRMLLHAARVPGLQFVLWWVPGP